MEARKAEEKPERWRCVVCGWESNGRIPKGGDGTQINPRRHSGNEPRGGVCDGYFEAAEQVKP